MIRRRSSSMRSLSSRSGSSPVRRARRGVREESGFTLVELLITVAILPIVLAGLGVGMLSVFKLQSGVSNRLTDTADSQVVQATFNDDVQSAQFITTNPSSTPTCGTGTLLIAMESNLDQTTGLFQDITSYAYVQHGSTYSLLRQYCTAGSSTPTKTTTITSNLQNSPTPPTVTFTSSAQGADATTQWVNAQEVASVSFTITQPRTNYTYTLVASPEASNVTAGTTGLPSAATTSSQCASATPGSGTYASTLCLIDFSGLTGNAMAAAQSGCLNMSVPLKGGYTMFFCLSITGGTVAPASLPTYGIPGSSGAFLGNSLGGVPFYNGFTTSSGATAYPALYQNTQGTTTVITFNFMTVYTPQGALATGWQAVSADAESTDNGESITWTTGVGGPVLNLLPNSPTSPYGNACAGGVTGNGSQTVTCSGLPLSSPYSAYTKSGTVMVASTTPTNLKITMVGTGLQAVAFGLLIAG